MIKLYVIKIVIFYFLVISFIVVQMRRKIILVICNFKFGFTFIAFSGFKSLFFLVLDHKIIVFKKL